MHPPRSRFPVGPGGACARLRARKPATTQNLDVGTITIAIEAHHPPCEGFADDTETIISSKPDVWNMVVQRPSMKVVVVSVEPAAFIPGVKAARYYDAFGLVSDSADRERQVAFVDFSSSAMTGYALTGDADASWGVHAALGRTGGVKSGPASEPGPRRLSLRRIRASRTLIGISEWTLEPTIVLALYSGGDDSVADDHEARRHILRYATRPPRTFNLGYLAPTFGAIVRTSKQRLAHALLRAFQAKHKDGSYAAIWVKCAYPPLALVEPGVNLVARH